MLQKTPKQGRQHKEERTERRTGTVFGGSLKGGNSWSVRGRYSLKQRKTLARKLEEVPNMDAHDGDAPTPVLN